MLVHYKNHHCHTSTYGFSYIQSAIRTYFVQAYEGKSNTLQQREEGSRRRKEEEERAGDVITAVIICQKASATNSFVLNVFWWEKLFQHMKNLTYNKVSERMNFLCWEITRLDLEENHLAPGVLLCVVDILHIWGETCGTNASCAYPSNDLDPHGFIE